MVFDKSCLKVLQLTLLPGTLSTTGLPALWVMEEFQVFHFFILFIEITEEKYLDGVQEIR